MDHQTVASRLDVGEREMLAAGAGEGLCRVESTGRLVLVSDTEFGEIMPDAEGNRLRIRPGT